MNEKEQRDQEASILAICMLIPEDKIREDMREGVPDICDEQSWKTLCRKYDVSSWMMAIRLSMLGYWKTREL